MTRPSHVCALVRCVCRQRGSQREERGHARRDCAAGAATSAALRRLQHARRRHQLRPDRRQVLQRLPLLRRRRQGRASLSFSRRVQCVCVGIEVVAAVYALRSVRVWF